MLISEEYVLLQWNNHVHFICILESNIYVYYIAIVIINHCFNLYVCNVFSFCFFHFVMIYYERFIIRHKFVLDTLFIIEYNEYIIPKTT